MIDELKHPHTEPAGQIDVSSVKHCLQQGDAKLALQYCNELLARDPQHIQILLFAALASRSVGWLDDALDQKGRVEVGDSSLESCAIAEVSGSSVECCELRVEVES